MPKLFHLHIENFRGIEKFDHTFKEGLTCIIGRGDSGKTTILDAISYVLTPMHTLVFYDGDFYNCDVTKPIIIEVTLKGLTDEILRKFGNHIRGIKDDKIITSMLDPDAQEAESAVTIQLKVEKDLEPQWYAIGADGTEPKSMRASERELFNCFYISEYNDRHFTLSKGTPLNTLFRQKSNKNTEILNAELIADLGRTAKIGFDNAIGGQEVFIEVIDAITQNATNLGLNSGVVQASLDQREFLLRENKIALHKNNIPLRQMGKGSKRLLSLAIQLSLTDPSGIILIDEIEQGLEPDRVQQIITFLRDNLDIQVILTTHSIHVVQALRCEHIYLKKFDSKEFTMVPSSLQGTILKHPQALFARKIIVTEGGTEWGFLSGLNEHRQQRAKTSFSFKGISLVDGNGEECFKTASALRSLGYMVLLFCDSDKEQHKQTKEALKTQGVEIIDCEEGLAFEHQIFKDCDWSAIQALIKFRINFSGQTDKSVYNQIRQRTSLLPPYKESWVQVDSKILRTALGHDAAKSQWFKSKELGKILSRIILNKKMSGQLLFNLNLIHEWIDRQ